MNMKTAPFGAVFISASAGLRTHGVLPTSRRQPDLWGLRPRRVTV